MKDERGTIAVQVLLAKKQSGNVHKKGNIHRTLTIKNAKVSEVFAALERFLFDEEQT